MNNRGILAQLQEYYTELKIYKEKQERLTQQSTLGHWYRERDEIREILVRKTGRFKQLLIDITGSEFFYQYDVKFNFWNQAFNATTEIPSSSCLAAISFCINTTNEAMGKLEGDIQNGIRDEKTGQIITKSEISEANPKEQETNRLNWKTIETDFGITKTAFGKQINFVTDRQIRNVLFRDIEQAYSLSKTGFSKPAVILAGGVIEEILRQYLIYKNIKPQKDDFNGYIRACEEKGLLKKGIYQLSDVVREFRNLVHISRERTSKHAISKPTAIGAVTSIFTIANDF